MMKRHLQQSYQVPLKLHTSVLNLIKIHNELIEHIKVLAGTEIADAIEVSLTKYSKVKVAETGKGGNRGGKGRPKGFTPKEKIFEQTGVSGARSISSHLIKIINEYKRLQFAYCEETGKKFE